jgi:ketosteroid isomerase-like protein
MSHVNADAVRALCNAWNARDFDTVAAQFTDDAEVVVAGSGSGSGSGETFHGREGARQFWGAWADAFPDARVTVHRIIEGNDAVVALKTGEGTHSGELATPAGPIAPTHRQVRLSFCDVFDCTAGKVGRMQTYFDAAALLAQLGMMPGAVASAR